MAETGDHVGSVSAEELRKALSVYRLGRYAPVPALMGTRIARDRGVTVDPTYRPTTCPVCGSHNITLANEGDVVYVACAGCLAVSPCEAAESPGDIVENDEPRD